MPTTPARPRVLLVADAHLNLVWALPRLLRQAGAEVVLMAPPEQRFRHSRFVDEWVEVPPADLAVIAARLAAHLARHPYALVVHAHPSLVEVLLQGAQPPPGMDWLRPEVARALATKTDFHPWALRHQVPVPPGRVCRTPAEACAALTELGPAVIKCNALHGGLGVWRVDTAADVRAVWPALKEPAAVLVQQFVAGPVGCTELILQRGRVAGWFASFKARTVTPFGASIMRRLVHPPDMAALVAALAAATGFHGLCGFDWVLDPATGRTLVLEFHPRAPSGFQWGRYAGVDVPAALRELLNDTPAVPRAPAAAAQLERAPLCCYFPAHFWWALTRRHGDLKYWLPGANAVAWRNVPLDDPRLLGSVLAFALGRLWRRHRPFCAPR